MLEEDPSSPVADHVATDVVANVTPFIVLSSHLVKICKKRLEVVKRLKNIKIKHIQLRNENIQLAIHEANVKRLMEQHQDEEDLASAQSGDNADNE